MLLHYQVAGDSLLLQDNFHAYDTDSERPSRNRSGQRLERRRNPLSAANAKRADAAPYAIGTHGMQQPRRQHRPGRLDRMAVRNGQAQPGAAGLAAARMLKPDKRSVACALPAVDV